MTTQSKMSKAVAVELPSGVRRGQQGLRNLETVKSKQSPLSYQQPGGRLA